MDDENILKLPEKKALQEIYKKYYLHVLRYSYSLCGDKNCAEDIASNTFLELNQKISTLTWQEVPLKAWLFKTAKFKYFSYYKKNLREDSRSDFFINFPDPQQKSVEDLAITTSLLKTLNETLQTFTKQEQEIVALRAWEDLKFSEIAKIVNLKPDTVKIKYYRVVKKLREQVGTPSGGKKKIRSFLLFLGNIEQFKKINILTKQQMASQALLKFAIPISLVVAIAVPVFFAYTSNSKSLPVINKDYQTELIKETVSPSVTSQITIESSTIAVTQSVKPTSLVTASPSATSSPSSILSQTPINVPKTKATIYYPNTKLITLFYPSGWQITRGTSTCASDFETRATSCYFFEFYSNVDDATLEINFSLPDDISIRPYEGVSFGPSVGTVKILGQNITKNSSVVSSLYYNDGKTAYYSDLKYSAYLYSGQITTYMNKRSQPLTSNFITQSDEVMKSITYQ